MSTKAPTLIPTAQTRANLDLAMRLASRYENMDLKTYKALKIGVLSVSVIGYAVFSVQQGADPNVVFTGTVLLLAILNGVEVTELASAWIEVRTGHQRPNVVTESDTRPEHTPPPSPSQSQSERGSERENH